MSLNITSKTVQDVATTVKRQFGDESGVQVTDADIYRWINDGQKEIVVKNKVLKGKATITAVANQAEYTLPEANIAVIESIHWNGIPIPGVAYPEVEQYILGHPTLFEGGTGVPAMWYEWAGLVTFWPTPATADTITLLYTRMPDPVVALTDTLSVPDKYFNTLLKFVMSQVYEMDEDWEASNFKSQQFTDDLNITADEDRSTQNMTYPVINVTVDY